MRCPSCAMNITETDKTYTCDCVVIPKEILQKKITPEIVHELLNNRRTKTLEGFVSNRTGKKFSATLVIHDKKVAFEFEGESRENRQTKGSPDHRDIVRIRVHSENSGTAHVIIKGTMYREFQISYGHVSSRMAECLACATAANLVKQVMKNTAATKLDISLNNLDFSRYILKERTPRDRDMKSALEHLFHVLAGFGGWCAQFKPEKRPRLTGSPQSNKFPRGVFPGLEVSLEEVNGKLRVTLPGDPDINAQFTASLQRAVPDGERAYTLPLAARPALMAWINSVKRGGYPSEVSQQ